MPNASTNDVEIDDITRNVCKDIRDQWKTTGYFSERIGDIFQKHSIAFPHHTLMKMEPHEKHIQNTFHKETMDIKGELIYFLMYPHIRSVVKKKIENAG